MAVQLWYVNRVCGLVNDWAERMERKSKHVVLRGIEQFSSLNSAKCRFPWRTTDVFGPIKLSGAYAEACRIRLCCRQLHTNTKH
jgi:hypothetical protein